MKLDREGCQTLRVELQTAVDEIVTRLDLERIKIGTMTYIPSTGEARMKVTAFAKLTDNTGKEVSREKADWESYAHLYGFKKSDYGRSFMYNGKPFTLKGFRLSASKFPIVAKDLKGKTVHFKDTAVLHNMI